MHEVAPDVVLDESLRDARPDPDDLAAQVARAKIATALFGAAPEVKLGRYTVESRLGGGGGGVVFAGYDPELSRRVAIKLLHAGGDRDHMLAEGQALARLSHPNIVPVHDAGVAGDQVYVVMELVEGETLRAYCSAPDRSTRDIVRAYRQAGEGLAEAHRAGFVHRDIKPDNLLVGRDGRVRIVDFGLARSGEMSSAPAAPHAPIEVTHAGIGTPRYMAPEQARGEAITPAADQYAFCASLAEALGARGPVPRWLDAIVTRGTAPDPTARFPSMEAVLAALARDPASRWRVRGLVAGVVALAAVAFLAGRSDHDGATSCELGAEELASIWSATSATDLRARLAALGTPYAREAAPHIARVLDGYAESWRRGHRDACVAHRDGAQSASLFDRRVACLSRAKVAFATVADIVRTARADTLDEALAATGELPDLARCADAGALVTSVRPPPPPVATAVEELGHELAALEIEIRAARPGARARATAAVERARATGYDLIVARALRVAGLAALAVYAREAAIAPLAEATTLALTAGDHALAVDAFARRVFAESTLSRGSQPAGAELVAAIAAGLPPAERGARALLDNNLGAAALAAGRQDDARAAFERALANARDLRGPLSLELAHARTNLALVIADPRRRAALARERIELVESALGDSHPLAIGARISAALLETHSDRSRSALAPACAQLVALHPDHGYEILECELELGLLALDAGDTTTARAAFGAALGTGASTASSSQLDVARGYAALLDGDADRADAHFAELVARHQPLTSARWWTVISVGDALHARGWIAEAAGRIAEARASYDAAHAAVEPIVAAHQSPHYARRLVRARRALVRVAPSGPLSPALRAHAEAALAWYREADEHDRIEELERALAR